MAMTGQFAGWRSLMKRPSLTQLISLVGLALWVIALFGLIQHKSWTDIVFRAALAVQGSNVIIWICIGIRKDMYWRARETPPNA